MGTEREREGGVTGREGERERGCSNACDREKAKSVCAVPTRAV